MSKQKVHYIPYEIDVFPRCRVSKNQTFVTTTNKDEVTCKACLKYDLDEWKGTSDIVDIFNIAKASAQEKEESMET